ncbi:endolytic transglycosylase MltG [Streptococcus dentiloxodontae]
MSKIDELFDPSSKSKSEEKTSQEEVEIPSGKTKSQSQKLSESKDLKEDLDKDKPIATPRSYKRPVWATSLDESIEEDYIPYAAAKEMIEEKAGQAIYDNPSELAAKISKDSKEEKLIRDSLSADSESSLSSSEKNTDAQPNSKKAKKKSRAKAVTDEDTEHANRPSRANRNKKRKKNNRRAGRLAAYIITVLILVLALAGFFGYRYVKSAVGALDANSTKYVTVEIPAGSGNKYIGQILEDAGVIKSGTIFNYYTKFKNASDFQSGYYNLQASMTLDEIIKALQAGGTTEPVTPTAGTILVKEGYTIEQIAKAVEVNSSAKSSKKNSTSFTSKEFLEKVKDKDFIAKMVEKYPKLLGNLPSEDQATYVLEGYLFPATYNYYDDTKIEDVIEDMIATMDSYMQPYYDTIASSGYNVNEILAIASLVEKEGATDDDRADIASVFYNRLNANMALQSNIAILYAQGKLGEETSLEEDASIDTNIDSPYNVYKNTGLMPGPVDSPSLSAIEATVNPSSTNYYYFVADTKTGEVYFAETYEDHEKNVNDYVNSQLTSNSSKEDN